MKYGICAWCLPCEGESAAKTVSELGLLGIEPDFSEKLETRTADYINAAEKYGICYPTMGLNVFCRTSYTEKNSEKVFEDIIRRALIVSEKLKVKTLQIPAFFASEIKNEENFDMLAKNLKTACELALPYGVVIGTENALTAEENKRLFDNVDMPNFKFYLDTQNLKIMKGIETSEVLPFAKDRLCEVHVKDGMFADEEKKDFRYVPLGEGITKFTESMLFLKESRYNEWIFLESDYCRPIFKGAGGFGECIKKDAETLKNIFR